MQTSSPHDAQRKTRWSSITRTRTEDVSGHGLRCARCSAVERRDDHRDDPEGSGGNPGLRLVSGLIGLSDGRHRDQESGASARDDAEPGSRRSRWNWDPRGPAATALDEEGFTRSMADDVRLAAARIIALTTASHVRSEEAYRELFDGLKWGTVDP